MLWLKLNHVSKRGHISVHKVYAAVSVEYQYFILLFSINVVSTISYLILLSPWHPVFGHRWYLTHGGLTHRSRNKIASVLQTTFPMHFLEWKWLWSQFHSNIQYVWLAWRSGFATSCHRVALVVPRAQKTLHDSAGGWPIFSPPPLKSCSGAANVDGRNSAWCLWEYSSRCTLAKRLLSSCVFVEINKNIFSISIFILGKTWSIQENATKNVLLVSPTTSGPLFCHLIKWCIFCFM